MDQIHPKLKEEYDRTLHKVSLNEFTGRYVITYEEVLKAHFLISDYFIQDGENLICGVKSIPMLGSALGRQFTEFGGFEKYKEPIEKCATLFFGIVKNHPFHDGNKRTALLTLIYHLDKIGRTIDAPKSTFEELAVNVAANQYNKYKRFKNFQKRDDPEINFLADFLRRKTRKTDKRYYQVTYREFNALLKRYNICLENQGDNYIDVVKYDKKKSFLISKEKVIKHKIMQIGFPGWKKKINMKAAKEVLKESGLVAENGIDSMVFFKEASPLGALIDEFRDPLMRLKDK